MPPTKLHNTWGKNTPEGSVRKLTTPTGSECEAERKGLRGLVEAGVLGESDTLTSLVDSKHIRRVRGGKGPDGDQIDVESLMSDPDSLGKILMVVDRAIPVIVLNPEVRSHFTDQPDGTTLRIPEEDRDESIVYTDQIALEDKMYLFNWAVGGSPDLERFHVESGGSVASVENGRGVSRPTKRAPRRR